MQALGTKVTHLFQKDRVLDGGHFASYQVAVLEDERTATRHRSDLRARRSSLAWSRWSERSTGRQLGLSEILIGSGYDAIDLVTGEAYIGIPCSLGDTWGCPCVAEEGLCSLLVNGCGHYHGGD